MFVHLGSFESLPGWPLNSWKIFNDHLLNTRAGKQTRNKQMERRAAHGVKMAAAQGLLVTADTLWHQRRIRVRTATKQM